MTFENVSQNYKDEIAKLRQELQEIKLNKTVTEVQKGKCEICDKKNHTTKKCFYNPEIKRNKKILGQRKNAWINSNNQNCNFQNSPTTMPVLTCYHLIIICNQEVIILIVDL